MPERSTFGNTTHFCCCFIYAVHRRIYYIWFSFHFSFRSIGSRHKNIIYWESEREIYCILTRRQMCIFKERCVSSFSLPSITLCLYLLTLFPFTQHKVLKTILYFCCQKSVLCTVYCIVYFDLNIFFHFSHFLQTFHWTQALAIILTKFPVSLIRREVEKKHGKHKTEKNSWSRKKWSYLSDCESKIVYRVLKGEKKILKPEKRELSVNRTWGGK